MKYADCWTFMDHTIDIFRIPLITRCKAVFGLEVFR
jgi:hypothetical protein